MAGWQFWIDRGGTFTDVVARDPRGALTTFKLLSENPSAYRDAAVAGIRLALALPPGAPLPADLIDHVKMGTTVATNALLERRGARTLLIVDEGFADLLVVGDQSRPRLFDLDIRLPPPLFEDVEEVGGRIGVSGAALRPLDEAATLAMLRRRAAEGYRSCAIALAHAWRHPDTERRVAALARAAGFAQVSASHAVSPLIGLVARGRTAVVDAYLSPVLRHHVARLAEELGGARLSFMQSHGGLADAADFHGKDAVLSGPAGGIVGAARTAEAAGIGRIVAFDMGGTSTDVALYTGAFERAYDGVVAGVAMRVPMMAIETVAAGGGSVLRFDGARFRVGPDSAGARPGPACYRGGGPLTVTDANVMVGKIRARLFPAVFGPDGRLPLDETIVAERFALLAAEVGTATGTARDPRAVAEGFLRVAVAGMAAAIKRIALARGEDVAGLTLACFGGAGGQHACLVAEELGMTAVLVHPYAGVLSAYGMGLADQSVARQRTVEAPLAREGDARLAAMAEELRAEAVAALREDGGAVVATVTAFVRHAGTDTALPVPFGDADAMAAAFAAAHRERFGFAGDGRALIVATLAAEVVRRGEAVAPPRLAPGPPPRPAGEAAIWSGGASRAAPVFDRAALGAGARVTGPALIHEATATTVIEPGWAAEVLDHGELLLRRSGGPVRAADADHAVPDPVLLELFNSRFMGIAERMGVVLRDTATSVNIKERLDFSCALFDAAGNLVANAPHVPVHLGAMGASVRAVLRGRGARLRPGDAIMLNDPFNGGTHLPDITLISPVFDASGAEPRFFVANRGHHADIGGLTPGSTPPRSRTLEEEGVVIDDFLLVRQGRFDEAACRALLGGARYPARSPATNIADLKAQLAANEAGVRELALLVERRGWAAVVAYMRHVRAHAEESVRRVIDRLRDGGFAYVMDDGAPLKVAVRIDRAGRAATIDFTGTGAQRDGNFNAPPAVTTATVLYAFRCLVGEDLPLNEGCLAPLAIVLPEGSFLRPRPGAAVVAGNTEVSQAVCCALLGALGACASAQGTMNNLLFGTGRYQYYETICGGAGAGPGFDGASAVQTHMTNTRTTDPEVLELRYPVRVERFAIRRGSGGDGERRGGDGAVRAIRALEPMTATIVSSRRTIAPFGLAGGGDGAKGRQWVERADGTRSALSGTDQAELGAGDLLVIETPGGGGFGACSVEKGAIPPGSPPARPPPPGPPA